jgi:hypothetical protein
VTAEHVHDWQCTGEQRQHAKIGKTVIVSYCRCTSCGQVGYWRPRSRVVYTWNPADAVAASAD